MSVSKDQNLQEGYLNDLRKRRQSVVIYLSNGVRQTGVIESFDRHALSLRQGTSTVLLYKHMVASVMPAAKALTSRAPEPEPEAPPPPRKTEPRPAPVIIRKVSRRTF